MDPSSAPEIRRELRTPRAAAIAGILFALLLGLALGLLHAAVPPEGTTAGTWLSESGRRTAVAVALNLIPFAGIAFLWFIGVVRDRIGAREDRFFATVFLGSGLLFIAMLFIAGAFAGGLVVEAAATGGKVSSTTLALGRRVTSQLLNIYAMRMAAVFTIATATIVFRTGVSSRWLAILGYASAAILLVSVGITSWVQLLFPFWILLLSIDLLIASLRRHGPAMNEGRAPSTDTH